jgi:predicted site-specific integrase-resolvase
MNERGQETKLYKTSEAANIIGVKPGILRKWANNGSIRTIRTPGGIRLFDLSSLDPSISKPKDKKEEIIILYSRVSSAKQKDDLERQKEYIKTNLPDKYSGSKVDHISDVGSGINFRFFIT